MDELQKELKIKLKSLNFEQLIELLNKTNIPEARQVIIDEMQEKDTDKFLKFLNEDVM